MTLRKILFVCIHNTCRSVIAETIFNAYAERWRAESAGIENAERIDETAVKLLKEKGFEVTKDKPRTLNEVNLKDYDLIVTVCEESCPFIPSRNVRQWGVEDPAGKEIEIYERAIREIEKRVRKLVDELEC